jgi:glycosyltransferase involved in cell wall biosynthesis
MGMGHYERILIQWLDEVTSRDQWRFDITFDGRGSADTLQGQCPGIGRADLLGFSTQRLARLPWPVARAAMHLRGARAGADLYHSLSLSFPAPPAKPAVYTIHDLPPARFPDEGSVPRWAKRAAAAAAAIVTPSQFAKNELVELLDLPAHRVHVIPNGCEHDMFHPGVAAASEAERTAKGVRGPFLLYAGGFTRRKNVRSLLTAWSGLASRYPDLTLALVGPAEQLGAIVAESNPSRVVVVGYLDHAVLRGWMKASVALVFPSIYEGFGLPPLEAMALGVPVVAVRAGALPEVVGDAGILAEDGTPDALRAAIGQVLDDPSVTARLAAAGPRQAAGFSWEQHARSVLHVYRAVLDGAV